MSALVPQETEISLTLGMATKPSEELQDPSSMRLVENLHWRELGGIERKPAMDTSAQVESPNGSLYNPTQACGLTVRGVDPLVVTGSHGVMAYDEAQAESLWTTGIADLMKFAPVSCDVSRRIVERVQGENEEVGLYKIASAQHEGVQVLAWVTHGSSPKMWFKAIEAETGKTIAAREIHNISGAEIHISACEYTEPGNEGVLIAYAATSSFAPHSIHSYLYHHATRDFVSYPSLTVGANAVVAMRFLVKKNGNRFYLAYRSNATGNLVVEDRSITTVASTHAGIHPVTFGYDIVVGPTRTLIVTTDTTNNFAEVFGSPASYITFASSALAVTCTAALETRGAGSTHDAVVWINEQSNEASEPDSSYVTTYEINFATTTPTASVKTSSTPHAWVVSNAFTLNERAHVTMALGISRIGLTSTVARNPASCVVARYVGHATEIDNAHHDPVARVCHDRFFFRADASNFDYIGLDVFPSTYVDTNNNAWIALTADPSPYPYTYSGADAYYPQTIMLCRVDGKRPMPMPSTSPANGVTMVAGGYPWLFDGDMAYEAGPVMLPIVEVVATAGTGETGSFAVIGVWRWTDAAGRQHRVASAPVLTGAISNKQIDVYVSQCPFTAYDGVVGPVMAVEVYITDGSTDVYQLAMTSTGTRMRWTDKTTNGLWYKFGDVDPGYGTDVTDAIFSTEIPPAPIPAFVHVSKVVDRLWAVDAEDRTRIWFTKPLVTGVGAEWSTECTLFIGDEAVAVVDIGGFPHVLARGGIYQIGGSGPDANGAGSFSPAQKMPFEVDCVDPVSVCRTPAGVVFRGRRGLYLLGNGLTDTPGLIMDPEMLTDPTLDPSSSTSYRLRVVYQEATSELHCLTPGGDRLVYNLNEQKWSKYTQSATTTSDIAVARGKLWRTDRSLSADLLVSEKLYAIDSSLYNVELASGWRIDTPWYRLDDVAGQVRLWRVWLALKLASDPADSSISLTYYTEWSESGGQTVTWTGAQLAALSAAGDKVVKLPFVPRSQVCSAFKLSISCSQSAATACPKPLAMRFQVGARPSKGKRIKGTVKG